MANCSATQNIRRAAEAIRNASALFITAGAGMGVDSGLPDFRGREGFWKAYPPMKHLGLDLPSMSNPRWFEKDPLLAWGFFGHRYQLYSKTKPHDGYGILLEWGRSMPSGYFVFTSNVDGHFLKAGFDEDCIVECHGSIHWLQCSRQAKCKRDIWSAAEDSKLASLKVDPVTFRASKPLPTCIHCGQVSRPNILMFGDYFWDDDRHFQQDSNMNDFTDSVMGGSENIVVIEIGAGLAVPTVRNQSEEIARDACNGGGSGTLIRINTTDAEVPSSGMKAISISLGGLEALRKIQTELKTI